MLDEEVDASTKARVRNQISAYQMRLKNRIYPLVTEMSLKALDD